MTRKLGKITSNLWSKVPKAGVGTLSAMGRQGFKEIRAALYPDSNVAQPTEHGIYGTATQGEIAEDRKKDEPHRSTLDEHVERAESRVEQKAQDRDKGIDGPQAQRDREGPELDRE